MFGSFQLKLATTAYLFLITFAANASTIPGDIRSQLAKPDKVGEVQVRFLGVRLYSAALFTEQGSPFSWQQPFALELKYARSFGKQRLIDASLSELERLEGKRADHAAISSKLANCYRSVKKLDRFVAIPRGRDGLSFYFNGRETCRITHSDIRNRLLGIWLSDKSRNARLSRNLRGLN